MNIRARGATRVAFALALVLFARIGIAAPAPPPPSPAPPSAMIFGSWTTEPIPEWYWFLVSNGGNEVYTGAANVPEDGAWVYGNAQGPYSQWMNCSQHYVGTLVPNNSVYTPLFIAGYEEGRDACLGSNCYSCSINWNGTKFNPAWTTDTFPAFLPAGNGVVELRSMNGGGDYSSRYDAIVLWLAQVNAADMQSMRVYQAIDEEDARPAQQEELDLRYYIANSDDVVPLVPEFVYGTETFPHAPGTTFQAKWDGGEPMDVEIQDPASEPSLRVLRVHVPKLSTGDHTITVVATLPSGKTYTAATTVFVYAQSAYLDVDGNFTSADPQDDLPDFVPGSDLAGESVSISASAGQAVQLNILAGRGATGSVVVELVNPSQYPGVAMNYPIDSTDVTPDMDFGSGALTKSLLIPKGKLKLVSTTLYVRDYAASAKLRVTIPLRKTTYTYELSLPRDRNGNSIADKGWTAGTATIADSGLAAGRDEDNSPDMPVAMPADGRGRYGDNLTNFEEYRGFFVRGEHRRTNPFKKDFFIDGSALGGDIMYAYPALPTATHSVAPEDLTVDQVINGNAAGLPGGGDVDPDGHRDQKAFLLQAGGDSPDYLASTVCGGKGPNEPWTPNDCSSSILYLTAIQRKTNELGGGDPNNYLRLRRNTVAHEAGHSVNLYHNDSVSCIMYGGGFTAQGGFSNLPADFCQGVTTKVVCDSCGLPYPYEVDVVNFNETDTLRIKK
jgi:hypothetical protein